MVIFRHTHLNFVSGIGLTKLNVILFLREIISKMSEKRLLIWYENKLNHIQKFNLKQIALSFFNLFFFKDQEYFLLHYQYKKHRFIWDLSLHFIISKSGRQFYSEQWVWSFCNEKFGQSSNASSIVCAAN